MSFKSGANGIEKKGKTVGKNYGDSGPNAKTMNGGKKTAGVTGASMKAVGRNMARANNQRGR
jgi:hypothetical protein